MAASSGTDVSSGNTEAPTWLDSLGGLVIDYGRARLIDSEHASDSKNIQDKNDLIARQSQATTANNVKLMVVGGALIIGAIVLYKVL